jgi:hypothetical protein
VLLYYRQVKGQIEIPTLRDPPEGVSAIKAIIMLQRKISGVTLQGGFLVHLDRFGALRAAKKIG